MPIPIRHRRGRNQHHLVLEKRPASILPRPTPRHEHRVQRQRRIGLRKTLPLRRRIPDPRIPRRHLRSHQPTRQPRQRLIHRLPLLRLPTQQLRLRRRVHHPPHHPVLPVRPQVHIALMRPRLLVQSRQLPHRTQTLIPPVPPRTKHHRKHHLLVMPIQRLRKGPIRLRIPR